MRVTLTLLIGDRHDFCFIVILQFVFLRKYFKNEKKNAGQGEIEKWKSSENEEWKCNLYWIITLRNTTKHSGDAFTHHLGPYGRVI